jgi:hypothetical protein
MRMSRVLLAGVAVAGVAASTSAFTNSQPLPAEDDIVGYGEVAVSGVTVSNVAYIPLGTDASQLDEVIFTVGEDTTGTEALLTVTGGNADPTSPISCLSSSSGSPATHLITCDVPTGVDIDGVSQIGLTVVSK